MVVNYNKRQTRIGCSYLWYSVMLMKFSKWVTIYLDKEGQS